MAFYENTIIAKQDLAEKDNAPAADIATAQNAIDAAESAIETAENARVRVANTGKGKGFVTLHIVRNLLLAGLLRPFVQTFGRVVNITVEKRAVVGKIHDLANRRTGAFRHHTIDNAFALRHPCSRKTHKPTSKSDQILCRVYRITKKQITSVFSMCFNAILETIVLQFD